MPYTEQQHQAIFTRDVSVALAAGAGCGKTFVLTERFVNELIRNPDAETLDQLLAITFTDRAAREMKDRIRERIRIQLRQCPEEEVLRWQSVLRDLETARIQTIHSFCTSTLRRFATELQLDPEFSVLDAPTSATLMYETAERTVEKLLRQKNDDVCVLVLRYGIEETVQLLKLLLLKRFPFREASQQAQTTDELLEVWQRWYRDRFLPALVNDLITNIQKLELMPVVESEMGDAPRWQERRTILLQIWNEIQDSGELTLDLAKQWREAATIQYVPPKNWSSPDVQETLKAGLKQIRDLLDTCLEVMEFDPIAARHGAELGLCLQRVGQVVLDDYQTRKRQLAALDFDDLLLETRNLLLSNPAVCRALQNSISFLLLDEFQDTDPVQTQIVRSICGERLPTGGLFLVGDIKQSIYRFRRADPNVFRQLRREIPDQGQLELTKNFRSQQGVLDFVNDLFTVAMGEEYEPLTSFDENVYPPDEKTEFLWSSSELPADASAREKRFVEADWIASRIRELLQDETPRIRQKNSAGQVELRSVRAGDITILFRAMSHLAVYEDALKRAGIGYYVVGGRTFFAQQEVYDLVNLCRFLDDDSDDIALVGVLRSPMFGCSDETLYLLRRPDRSLWQSLQSGSYSRIQDRLQLAAVGRAREILIKLLLQREREGIGPLLRNAVAWTGYDAALMTEFLGERKVANLQKLLTMADQFDQLGLLGLTELCDRLIESVTEEAQEELAVTHAEAGDVVRLMTVHQSKGLEFPVVIVADLNPQAHSSRDSLVVHPELGMLVRLPVIQGQKLKNPALMMHHFQEKWEEERESIRLFYVACTRAADLLILSAYWTEEETVKGAWLKLLQQRYRLETGLTAGDPYLGTGAGIAYDPASLPKIRVIRDRPAERFELDREQTVPLQQWAEYLAESAAETPPAMALPVPPLAVLPSRISVSELEAIDARLQPVAAARGSSNREQNLTAEQAEQLGNLVHAAVELGEELEQFSPEQIVDRLAARSWPDLPEEIRQLACSRLAAFQDSDLAQRLQQGAQVYREIVFAYRWRLKSGAAVLLSGVVDCLYQDSDGNWHLIDYKTGAVPVRQADLIQKFGIQLFVYQLAMKEFFGQDVHSTTLVQLGKSIQEIPFLLETGDISQLQQRIEQAILQSESIPPDELAVT
ncbi:MAG: UvrD-helicase domain-containing protein [Planctomycetaceae bacterium]|nr:UvrD-helicase domain-containing protein [Planctomycetaceae bacterium]